MPAPLTAGEILDEALEDGREELARGSAGLALSGLGAGLEDVTIYNPPGWLGSNCSPPTP